MKFNKCPENPILKPNPENEWEALCVLNPACVYKDGYFWLMYRAAADNEEHIISIGLAKSKDGIHFERCFDKPILTANKYGPDGNGMEDPRVIEMNGTYFMTYASRPHPSGRYWLHVNRKNYSVFESDPVDAPKWYKDYNTTTNLAMSNDLVNWYKCGRMTDSRHDDRDVFIFPEKIGGKYVMLSRSHNRVGEEYGCKVPSIWISYSDDILEWDNYKLLCTAEQEWEGKKIGGSTPPVKTDKGWLVLYHGVEDKEKGKYRVGALLLDLENPEKIIARTKEPLMEPEEEYECSGPYAGCVFPTAAINMDGTLYIYYGAGDRYCCLATCDLDELVNYLVDECSID
ncbi:MAG: glycosidase [Acutalibacteraceae bacterium]|nr:glycosidase [Acutalibacteraceae bacterium]